VYASRDEACVYIYIYIYIYLQADLSFSTFHKLLFLQVHDERTANQLSFATRSSLFSKQGTTTVTEMEVLYIYKLCIYRGQMLWLSKCIKSKNDFLNGNMDIEYRAPEIYIYLSLSQRVVEKQSLFCE